MRCFDFLFFIFFFFFKQKTAYEMRISDWSSDVCSSDLASGGIDVQHHIMRFAVLRDFVGEAAQAPIFSLGDFALIACVGDDNLRSARLYRRLGVVMQQNCAGSLEALAEGESAEIGRASCRARVCR